MQITTGGAQTLMPQQQLEAPQIDTSLQQVTGKRMAERISTLLIIRR
jgi:hypothetical protein